MMNLHVQKRNGCESLIYDVKP